MVKAIIFIVVITLTLSFLFYDSATAVDRCVSCHNGVETVSDNHQFICTDCHGGDSTAKSADVAHMGMKGGKNPSDPSVWGDTCGKCHELQVKSVASTIMLTNTGMIKNTQIAWGEEFKQLYSTMEAQSHDKDGYPIKLHGVDKLDTIAGELYRKFCGSCHIAVATDHGYMGHRSSGCAACHFKYNEVGRYKGGDTQIYDMQSYSETHEMQKLPNDDVCMSCHNRSGRIAPSYKGLYDGNNSLVPTKLGEPGPLIFSEVRNFRNMPADIHHDGGMECIDCHTQAEVMGDGYSYENMYNQLEISCESCHGDGEKLPITEKVTREMNSAFVSSANYKNTIKNGADMVLTKKGRPFSNVFKSDGKIWLQSKRTDKLYPVKTIQNTPEHKVVGHGKVDCISCHSRVVVQCYGCHTVYDERGSQTDFIKGEELPGEFFETEDLRTFYPFPLAVNERGKIAPTTPGCQTFFSYIDKEGNTTTSEYVFDFRGKKMLKFAPFYGHNTGKKAITCAECHTNTFFYGYGDGLFSYEDKTLISPLLCDECDKPLNALYSIKNGKQDVTADIVRENSRILNSAEISRMINANLCIVCHDKADDKYYSKEVDYEKTLNDNIHAPLLR